MAEQYSSFISSGTQFIFLNSDANVRCHGGIEKWDTRAYHKKWYFPIYFPNSVSSPNISKINANGLFHPMFSCQTYGIR